MHSWGSKSKVKAQAQRINTIKHKISKELPDESFDYFVLDIFPNSCCIDTMPFQVAP